MAIRLTLDINPRRLDGAVGPILRRKHASITRQTATEARSRVPVLTGNLGRSLIEMPQEYSALRVTGGVETRGVPYAAAVHEGSRPHRIVARRAKALRFMMGGEVVFRKSVWHPGTKARPFLTNAAQAVIARDPDLSRR